MTPQELRKISGLKAYKIAEILGISRVQLHNLENGKYKLDKLKIEKLCEVYQKNELEIISAFSKGGANNVGKRKTI